MSKCPHLDTILGLHEPITRRDFLEGALVGPSAALIATACPFPLRAQASATSEASWIEWTGYTGEGDYKGSAGNTGQVIQSDVQLQAGESAFLDLNGDAVVPPSTNGAPQRLQLRPVVNVLQEPSGKYPPGPCFPTMEVFDNATGRTSLFAQAILPGHPVRH